MARNDKVCRKQNGTAHLSNLSNILGAQAMCMLWQVSSPPKHKSEEMEIDSYKQEILQQLKDKVKETSE